MRERTLPQMGGNHKRAVSVTLSLLDEALCRFEEWANGREHHSVFYDEVNSLSGELRENILAEIVDMRGILRCLYDDLHLTGSVQHATTDIWARCNAIRLYLVETEGKRLKRYGDIHPDLASYVDEKMALLEQRLNRISGMLSDHGKARNPGSSKP